MSFPPVRAVVPIDTACFQIPVGGIGCCIGPIPDGYRELTEEEKKKWGLG